MWSLRRVAVAAIGTVALTVGLVVVPESPASASNFEVKTPGGTGSIEFIDYGPGRPGGGSNDDYFLIHDYSPDHHGVMAWLWVDGDGMGAVYNGRGYAGAPVLWDPYQFDSNWPFIVEVQVCNIDGPNGKPFNCSKVRSHVETH
jgi:hypothetical protein